MRVGGLDKCPKKQLLKFKEHKILRGEKKDTAVHSSKQSPQMTCFHDSQPLHQESTGLIYTGIQSPKHP